ncbi:tyrosine-type recombinase/integrase [Algoriphagus halophilus]|uniref:site-specific integrase n=1 Tax=Algoriphagus halophilus TaxID=226505 RepID=UPI00358F84F6
MASITSIIKKSYRRKDGKSAIYLRIIIDRRVKLIPLKVFWYPKKFVNGRCKVPTTGQKEINEAKDINLILGDAEARASEILIQYRLKRKTISVDKFLEEYELGSPSDDFLIYMESKMKQRLREHEISLSTYKTQLVALNHLKKWKKRIPFDLLNERTAYQFDDYLTKKAKIKSINGRFGRHRDFKTYLNQAKSDQVQFMHPYDFFRIKSVMGRFKPLHRDELIRLWNVYLKKELSFSDQSCLRGFLLCCFTGMRHSDVRRFSLDWVDGDFFEFEPLKTLRFGTKVRVPATDYALRLIADELDYNHKKGLFKNVCEQKQNESVRDIGQNMELSTPLCYQVGRETFATLYMEMDGKLEVLASLLGHTTTKMSEKYVKIRDQRKKEEARRISNFLKMD